MAMSHLPAKIIAGRYKYHSFQFTGVFIGAKLFFSCLYIYTLYVHTVNALVGILHYPHMKSTRVFTYFTENQIGLLYDNGRLSQGICRDIVMFALSPTFC